MKNKKNILLGAAVAGILTGLLTATNSAGEKKSADANDFNKKKVEPCYGINACKGLGQCGGKNSSCAGSNDCKGKGWINVEQGHCKDIQGGSTTPVEDKKN